MKSKTVIIAAALAVLTAAMPANAAVNYSQAYDKTLRAFRQVVMEGSDENVNIDGTTGLAEAVAGKKNGAAAESVGFAIKDISGDGIPELLIGAVTERKGAAGRGSRIYAVYTCVNGTPQFSFEGWARNSLDYMGNGRFFRKGSNGAMYSIFGQYKIAKNGTALRCIDYYFTFEKDKDFKKIGYFYNNSGKWDKAASKELGISQAQFSLIEMDLTRDITAVELTPFPEYKKQASAAGGPAVRAQWFNDVKASLSSYEAYTPKSAGPLVKIVFTAAAPVRDFKLLALTPVEKNGTITFTSKERHSWNELAPGRPLVIGVTFAGDLPNNGVSYVDSNGKTHRFAIAESGEDGSLLMTSF